MIDDVSTKKMTFAGLILRNVPIVRRVMDYIDVIENNAHVLVLLVKQVQQHQKILEQFVNVTNNLANSIAGPDPSITLSSSKKSATDKLN